MKKNNNPQLPKRSLAGHSQKRKPPIFSYIHLFRIISCLLIFSTLSILGCKKYYQFEMEKPAEIVTTQNQVSLTSLETTLESMEIVEEPPILLFVPGYTGKFDVQGDIDFLPTKENYYKYQIPYFRDKKGRTVINMNGKFGFDSDRSAIHCNADAIASMIKSIQKEDNSRKVTLISHSKGGQDVLHALITNKALWPTVAGWVAFTSNFFEGTFPIVGDRRFGSDCTYDKPKIPKKTVELGYCLTPENPPSAYTTYNKDNSRDSLVYERQKYMNDHQEIISDLMKCVPTLCGYGSYQPRRAGKTQEVSLNKPFFNVVIYPGNVGALNRHNEGIREESKILGLDRANDGLVPARAARIPGARFNLKLPGDPETNRCGVDHLAPALLPDSKVFRFWTPDYQVDRTREYINMVEAEKTDANAGTDQIKEVQNNGPVTITLDGSKSKTANGAIDSYEWFEGIALLATGINPSIEFIPGVHNIVLRVTSSCGVQVTDKVVINVKLILVPEILLVISPTTLWPPDNKMYKVASGIAAVGFGANPLLTVTVSSNETSNGNNNGDWDIKKNADGSCDVWVKAKRNGNGTSRIYTINATASDSEGNNASKSGTVTIPHDQGKK